MKRLLTTLTAVLSVLALSVVATPLRAHAASDWQLKISTPSSPLNSSSFNVQYTALAINPDSFTVSLYEDETLVGTQNTATDPNGINGNSGAFAVTAADGHHSFHLVAVRDSDHDTKTADTAVDVDATAPGTPTYLGKNRSGNTYTLRFTAPTNGDVTQIRIYSSTSTTFTANGASQVGIVAVSPGQTTSFSYTATSSAERFNAIRAFDAAGNGSAATGDTNTVVTTTVVAGTPVNAATNTAGTAIAPAVPATNTATTTNTAAPAGQVQGASTTNTPQTSSTSTTKPSTTKKGSVLGIETTKKSSGTRNLIGVIAIVVVAAAAYYWFVSRPGRHPFRRTPKA